MSCFSIILETTEIIIIGQISFDCVGFGVLALCFIIVLFQVKWTKITVYKQYGL